MSASLPVLPPLAALAGLGSIAAVVLGAVALRRIHASKGRLRGAGLARLGIALGVTQVLAGALGAYLVASAPEPPSTDSTGIAAVDQLLASEVPIIYGRFYVQGFPGERRDVSRIEREIASRFAEADPRLDIELNARRGNRLTGWFAAPWRPIAMDLDVARDRVERAIHGALLYPDQRLQVTWER